MWTPGGDCDTVTGTGTGDWTLIFVFCFLSFLPRPPCLSPVCESSEVGRRGDAVRCVDAPTVPTAGFIVSPGKKVYTPAKLPGFLS